MKKLLFLTALGGLFLPLLTNAASTAGQAQAQEQKPENPPVLYLGAIDAKNPARGFLENSTDFYKRYPNRHLCWAALNVPNVGDSADVVEIFISPSKTSFTNATSSADGKEHKIVSKIAAITLNNNMKSIEKCWQFDQNDPIGNYQVRIFVNNIEFPVQNIRLLK